MRRRIQLSFLHQLNSNIQSLKCKKNRASQDAFQFGCKGIKKNNRKELYRVPGEFRRKRLEGGMEFRQPDADQCAGWAGGL
jgi:glutamine synthetase